MSEELIKEEIKEEEIDKYIITPNPDGVIITPEIARKIIREYEEYCEEQRKKAYEEYELNKLNELKLKESEEIPAEIKESEEIPTEVKNE